MTQKFLYKDAEADYQEALAYDASDHIASSNGAIDTGKPITLNIDGKIDPSMLSDQVAISKACAVSASIGDIVMDSTIISNGVETVINNIELRPAYGIILSKPTTTTCIVLKNGEFSIGAGLTDGQKVFLSITGNITSTPPTTGYLQCLGVAVEANKISFNPQLMRVKRS